MTMEAMEEPQKATFSWIRFATMRKKKAMTFPILASDVYSEIDIWQGF